MKPNWRSFAILTFAFFGITNFLLGYIAEGSKEIKAATLYAAIILWLGMGLMGGVSYAIFRFRFGGYRGIPGRVHVVLASVAGLSLAFGMLSLKIGFYSDPLSKGPIVAIVSTNSLIVGLLSWRFLKEKLRRIQLIGFGLIIGGIITISLAETSEASLTGIFFGLITMVFFAVTNYILKLLGERNVNSYSAVSILWIAAGIFGLTCLAVNGIFFQFSINKLPLLFKLLAFLSGLLLGLGMFTLKSAVTRGPAGPVVAIAGSNAILVAALDYLFFKHLPHTMKLVGMGAVILGIVISTYRKKRLEPAEE